MVCTYCHGRGSAMMINGAPGCDQCACTPDLACSGCAAHRYAGESFKRAAGVHPECPWAHNGGFECGTCSKLFAAEAT